MKIIIKTETKAVISRLLWLLLTFVFLSLLNNITSGTMKGGIKYSLCIFWNQNISIFLNYGIWNAASVLHLLLITLGYIIIAGVLGWIIVAFINICLIPFKKPTSNLLSQHNETIGSKRRLISFMSAILSAFFLMVITWRGDFYFPPSAYHQLFLLLSVVVFYFGVSVLIKAFYKQQSRPISKWEWVSLSGYVLFCLFVCLS